MDPWRIIDHWFSDTGSIRAATHAAVKQQCRPQLKAASSEEIRHWSVVALEASSRSAPLLKSPVRMTAPSSMHKSRMSSNNAMQKDLRLAHSLLMWTLTTFKWEHDGSDACGTCQQQPCPRQPTKSTWASRRRGWAYTGGREGVLVEEYSAMVLGDHVKELSVPDPS